MRGSGAPVARTSGAKTAEFDPGTGRIRILTEWSIVSGRDILKEIERTADSQRHDHLRHVEHAQIDASGFSDLIHLSGQMRGSKEQIALSSMSPPEYPGRGCIYQLTGASA
jgi:hypothetical protein